jgi:hypothetical protein
MRSGGGTHGGIAMFGADKRSTALLSATLGAFREDDHLYTAAEILPEFRQVIGMSSGSA